MLIAIIVSALIVEFAYRQVKNGRCADVYLFYENSVNV
jgi:hypothetical protein